MDTRTDAATSPLRRRQNTLRGIAYLSGGVAVFSLHDICMKLLSGSYPLSEVMFVRSLTAAPLMLLVVAIDAGLGALATARIGIVVGRAVILLTGYLSFYLGFAALPFADAVALYSAVPLVIIALAAMFLGERVGWVRWLAVAAGFAGVLIMLKPGSGVFEPAALLILLCAFTYSLGMVMARAMGTVVPASVMAFYSNLLFLLMAIGLGLLFGTAGLGHFEHPSLAFLARPWVMPTPTDLGLMIAAGVTAGLGIIGLTFAYREAEANLIASFEYTALIWASLWGFLIWGEVLTASTLIGAALIVGAGLVALFARRPRAAPKAADVDASGTAH